MIIGVVASLTLPEMIADWQKQETVSRLKKVYSTLQNALNLSVAINGHFGDWLPEMSESELGNVQYPEVNALKEYYIPYLNIAHICESRDDNVCNYEFSASGYKQNLSDGVSADIPAFILNDGTMIFFSYYYDSMNDRPNHLYFVVDINGAKKPNKTGRDVFMGSIRITKTTEDINFFHKDGYSREELLETCKDYGQGCAGLIMADGWQIKDDYPW